MKMLRKQKGITLIALVVTIVVLLILAGITIGNLTGNESIIKEANSAKTQAERVALEEQIEAAIVIAEQKYKEPTLAQVIKEIEKIDTVVKVNTENGDIENKIGEPITGKLDEYLKKSLQPTEETKPYLPDDNSEVLSNDYNEGVVVKDKKGNEWVWIEVPRTTTVYPIAGLNIITFTDEEYKKIEDDLKAYTSDYRDGTLHKDEYYSEAQHGFTKEQYDNHKKDMLKSVYQNGGFYIGRYEAGATTYVSSDDNGAREAIIRQDAFPYNFVTCKKAQELSEGLATGGKQTSLMFGVQWDLVLKHIEERGTKLGASKEERKSKMIKTNYDLVSSDWGNYNNVNFTIMGGYYSLNGGKTYEEVREDGYSKPKSSVLLTTGATERNSVLNIYDLGGNEWEWTLEYTARTDGPCTHRGSGFNVSGSEYSVSNRGYNGTSIAYGNLGFRPALW